jgi:hypothetical protein
MEHFAFGLFASNELLTMQFDAALLLLPGYIMLWLYWLVFVGLTSIVWSFFKVEARFVAAAYVATFGTMAVLQAALGADRVLYVTASLMHVLFWTPALLMLYRRRANANFGSLYGIWLCLAMATMTISLIFDFRDVIAYLLI